VKNKLLVFSAFDLYAFLLSILIAMWFGNVFSPNLFAFLLIFILSKAALYFYWFKRVEKARVPWNRLAIHTTIILTATPLLVAVSASVSIWFSNVVFWLLVVPIFVFAASYLLHHLYRIFPKPTQLTNKQTRN